VAHFIVDIVSDVLGHITVQILEREDIGWIASLGTAKLRVLSPQIGLDDFGGCKKLEDRGVSGG